jgi:exopolyphosphatase/pppGpp-phosphohydrolase
VEPSACVLALAVGGVAAWVRRIWGDRLYRPTLTATLERLCAAPSAELAAELDLDARRVRLLPAALIVFEQLCELVPEPLRIARGGMREGLALALAERAAPAAEGR